MAVTLPVIAGPTATGKTRLGVAVAHRLGAEIVSADSRQVYRGLDIGTGKDLDEYRSVTPPVRVNMLDVADPAVPYSVFRYQQAVFRLLEARDGETLVMVGGTGLYIEAVLRDFRIANVPEDEALRRALMRRGLDELVRELRESAPDLASRTDLSSRKRVVRALEIAAHARRAPVEHGTPCAVAIRPTVFVVDVPREEAGRRIDRRLDERLEEGLVEEVEGLLEAGVPRARLDQLGLEYREVAAFLAGDVDRATMVDNLRREIRALAKRQRTWFRGMPRRGIPVTPVGPHDEELVVEALASGRRA